jgi:hypothetical protein
MGFRECHEYGRFNSFGGYEMPHDIDLEAQLRREAMDRLIAASTGDAASRENSLPSRSVPASAAPARTAGPEGNIAA